MAKRKVIITGVKEGLDMTLPCQLVNTADESFRIRRH